MGYSRLAIYLVGLVVVVLATWIFLTQTPVGQAIPFGVALALILLLVGIGIMASASSINDARYSRRVVRDNMGGGPGLTERRVYNTGPNTYVGDRVVEERTAIAPHGETIVEEKRLD